MTTPVVRLAETADLAQLPEIERSAAAAFDGGNHLRSLAVLYAPAETWIATLTTFRDARWNAPFYASLGFMEAPLDDACPRLGAILAREARLGLDPARRCAMKLSLR